MKKLTKELTDKSIAELEAEAVKLRGEIAKMTLTAKASAPKNSNEIFTARKKLAVVLTVLGLKKEAGEKTK